MVANPEMFPWGPSKKFCRLWFGTRFTCSRTDAGESWSIRREIRCGSQTTLCEWKATTEPSWRAQLCADKRRCDGGHVGNHELRHQRLKARKDFWFYSSVFAFNRALIFFFCTELIQQMRQTWQRYGTKKKKHFSTKALEKRTKRLKAIQWRWGIHIKETTEDSAARGSLIIWTVL